MPKRNDFAAFVDRDGTVCFDKHYLADPSGLELIPTAIDGIRRLNEAEIPVILVTNQSGIGRGYFTEKTLSDIHAKLEGMLLKGSAKVDDIFYCPHLPNSGCSCRKPQPGMLIQAKMRHGFDLTRSFVIGDRMMDVEMAHKVGANGILVPEPGNQYDIESEIKSSKDKPDFRATTLVEAVDWILAKVVARDH